jgi:hypothetical protein
MKAPHAVVSQRSLQEIGARRMLWGQVVKTANYQEDALSVPLLFAISAHSAAPAVGEAMQRELSRFCLTMNSLRLPRNNTQ